MVEDLALLSEQDTGRDPEHVKKRKRFLGYEDHK